MSRRVVVVGAGWAGLAAAIAARRAGHAVTVLEASRVLGGRARTVPVALPGEGTLHLDNGQHILIGAYRETLRMMRLVGVDPERMLLRMPLSLRFPDGTGLALPAWPAPLDAAAGIFSGRGWSLRDKLSLLRAASRWRGRGFECGSGQSVLDLCHDLSPKVRADLIEPLCVSALNTPADRASAQVFLRVVRDSLFASGGSNLLLPRVELGALFPEPAAEWLRRRGATILLGERARELLANANGWRVNGASYDAVLLACPAPEAARLVAASGIAAAAWLQLAAGLAHESIATVYVNADAPLPRPLMPLRADALRPAQFVFDRSQLGGPRGLLAFVVSACPPDRRELQERVVAQACELGLGGVQPLKTVLEKRATFACTPGLQRPGAAIAPGLIACGDYVDGPYPATLEGAVRSGLAAAALIA